MSKRPLWMARAVGGGGSDLGIPTFAAGSIAAPKAVYWEDFANGVSADNTVGPGVTGVGGATWHYSRAAANETVGLSTPSATVPHSMALNCTTNADRITVKLNTRVSTGGGNLWSVNTAGYRTHFAARWGQPSVASCASFVGMGSISSLSPGFTVGGVAANIAAGVTPCFGFYYNTTDGSLRAVVVSGGLQVDQILTAAPSGQHKCELLLTGDGSAATWVAYLDGAAINGGTLGSWSAGVAFCPILEMSLTATASRTMSIDYLYAQQTLAAAR